MSNRIISSISRKGSIGIQFNWIFVFIAGAVIFAFFVMLVTTYQQREETKMAMKLASTIDTVIKSSRSTAGIHGKSEVLETRLYSECEGDSSQLIVSRKKRFDPLWTQDTSDLVLFSPKMLEGRRLHTLSYEWRVPYPVMSFVYLTTDSTIYYFVNDTSDYMTELYGIMHNSSESRLVKHDELSGISSSQGYSNYVFVFADRQGAAAWAGLLGISARARQFDGEVGFVQFLPGSAGISGDGEVYFYKSLTDSPEQSYFYSKEMLLGAVYSSGKAFYECNVLKAVRRYEMIRMINFARVTLLRQHDGIADDCKNRLSASEMFLSSRISSIEVTAGLMTTIASQSGSLQSLNFDLSRKSCPTIY